MSSNKLDDFQEIALRAFLDDQGRKTMASILDPILKSQQRNVLSWNVTDEASERRLIALKHQLTGAELLYRAFFVELEKFSKEPKK